MKNEKNIAHGEERPLRLVNAAGAAALMGISRQRFAQLLDMDSDRIPEPYGIVSGKVPQNIWRAAQFLCDED